MDLKTIQAGVDKDYFWYRAKLDLIEVLLKKTFDNAGSGEEARILNVGAGSGDDQALMSKYGKVYAIDVDQKAVETLNPEYCFEKKVCSITNIDYPDDYFDVVVLFDVLEYIDDDKLAIKEVKRVLKPGGKLLLTVPALQSLYSAHDRFYNHKRRYDKKTLKSATSDLYCEYVSYWMFLLFIPIALKKLQNKEGAKVVSAKLPPVLSKVLYAITKLELSLIKLGMRFPFGVTLYGIYRK